jgi:TRAP-type mannitol/chloroaromatic compound transport system permease small subunit
VQFLTALARHINIQNHRIGLVAAWIVLPMILLQVIIVLMRYVFGIGSVMLQESIVYMHAFLFMVMAGYTLLHDSHVRIDVFYREASPQKKALINLIGSVAFLIPVCVLIIWVSWTYVSISWSVLEGSKETSGIPGVFLLKSLLIVFAALVGIQGVSLAVRSICVLRNLPWPESEEAVKQP